MATVVMTYPLNGGTYQTDANGDLVPFLARGYCDMPSAPVSLREDSTGYLLGTAASAALPEGGSGPYSDWYPWSIWVYSWSASAGLGVPAATMATTVAAPKISDAVRWLGGVWLNSVAVAPAITQSSGLALPPVTIITASVEPAISGGGGFTDDFATNSIASYTLSGTLSSGLSVTGGKLQHYNAGDIGTGGSANAERTGFSLMDGTVRATLKAGADLNGGLAAAGNAMGVYARWTAKYVGAQIFSGGLRLVQYDATFSVLGTYAFTPALNTDYVVELVLSGSSVVVNLNGTQRITGTTTALAAGTAVVSFERGSWDDGLDFYTNGGTYYADDLHAG